MLAAETQDPEIAEQLKPQKLEGLVTELRKQSEPKIDESFFGPPATQPAAGAPAAIGEARPAGPPPSITTAGLIKAGP